MGRVLAIDYGHKRVGLALSDESRQLASPLKPLQRTSELLTQLQKLCTEHTVELMVVGYPLRLDGSVGEAARNVEQFAEKLKATVGIAVELVDERLSTSEAQKAMIEGGASRKRRKEMIDSVAAAMFLQTFLDGPGRE